MYVVGIDPAPKKLTTTFDGAFRERRASELADYVQSLATRAPVLVCWDAPLTGPQAPHRPGHWSSDFSQRQIEQFFSRRNTKFKTPPGISVRPYSGCPHWAVSRATLGLPRVGPWDRPLAELPLRLITDDQPPNSGANVVEVHPAVALWLWCRADRPKNAGWEYKQQPEILAELCRSFSRVSGVESDGLTSDDQLDALVAHTLGTRWLSRDNSVVLLGNQASGAMLLPEIDGLVAAFADFAGRPAV